MSDPVVLIRREPAPPDEWGCPWCGARAPDLVAYQRHLASAHPEPARGED